MFIKGSLVSVADIINVADKINDLSLASPRDSMDGTAVTSVIVTAGHFVFETNNRLRLPGVNLYLAALGATVTQRERGEDSCVIDLTGKEGAPGRSGGTPVGDDDPRHISAAGGAEGVTRDQIGQGEPGRQGGQGGRGGNCVLYIKNFLGKGEDVEIIVSGGKGGKGGDGGPGLKGKNGFNGKPLVKANLKKIYVDNTVVMIVSPAACGAPGGRGGEAGLGGEGGPQGSISMFGDKKLCDFIRQSFIGRRGEYGKPGPGGEGGLRGLDRVLVINRVEFEVRRQKLPRQTGVEVITPRITRDGNRISSLPQEGQDLDNSWKRRILCQLHEVSCAIHEVFNDLNRGNLYSPNFIHFMSLFGWQPVYSIMGPQRVVFRDREWSPLSYIVFAHKPLRKLRKGVTPDNSENFYANPLGYYANPLGYAVYPTPYATPARLAIEAGSRATTPRGGEITTASPTLPASGRLSVPDSVRDIRGRLADSAPILAAAADPPLSVSRSALPRNPYTISKRRSEAVVGGVGEWAVTAVRTPRANAKPIAGMVLSGLPSFTNPAARVGEGTPLAMLKMLKLLGVEITPSPQALDDGRLAYHGELRAALEAKDGKTGPPGERSQPVTCISVPTPTPRTPSISPGELIGLLNNYLEHSEGTLVLAPKGLDLPTTPELLHQSMVIQLTPPAQPLDVGASATSPPATRRPEASPVGPGSTSGSPTTGGSAALPQGSPTKGWAGMIGWIIGRFSPTATASAPVNDPQDESSSSTTQGGEERGEEEEAESPETTTAAPVASASPSASAASPVGTWHSRIVRQLDTPRGDHDGEELTSGASNCLGYAPGITTCTSVGDDPSTLPLAQISYASGNQNLIDDYNDLSGASARFFPQ